ncbi:GldG family protein [Waterburya agarophytonicola]|uniref:GldG family protein n=1 Tax=Waterburya agarophytonicola TaxID=2886916 RepID=UPI001E628738|nr:Gldg family protein [Waterburya agarophytonicola]
MTENQIYTLSTLSQAVVQKLEEPLEILVFDRNINPNLESLLKKYQNISQKFKFRFINPEQKLGLAQEYGVQFLGEIHLQYGDKQQKLNIDNGSIGEPITETQLTNSIEKIQRDRITQIYLLQGHGEASSQLVQGGIAQVVKNLEDKGNNVTELNLASSGKIPDRTDLIIIAGATRKLLTSEVSRLQTYLSAGGSLLLLLSPNTDIGITPLLREWGIELDNRLVVDGSGAGDIMGFGPGVAIVNNYGNHPITANFANGISIFPESRPLKIIKNTGIKSTPLAITSEQTWAERDLKNEEIVFDPNQDLSGPLNIAIALESDRSPSSRLVIFGSATFATNGWFEQQLNADMIINSVNWLIKEEREILTIRPREVANRRINLSSLEARAIDWLAWRIIPSLALGIAIYLWSQRR